MGTCSNFEDYLKELDKDKDEELEIEPVTEEELTEEEREAIEEGRRDIKEGNCISFEEFTELEREKELCELQDMEQEIIKLLQDFQQETDRKKKHELIYNIWKHSEGILDTYNLLRTLDKIIERR